MPLNITATDDCTPIDQLTYSHSIDLDNDGSVNLMGDSSDASGTFDAGTHRVLFSVRDDCGNTESCSFTFTVRDASAPNVICNTDTFDIENVGGELIATIIPEQLILNTTDNCSSLGDLTVSVRPAFFNCTKDSLNQVTVIVTDSGGNSDSCLVDVFISDTNNLCPANRKAVNISGVITNEMGERVEEVEVSINHPAVPTAMTNIKGEFSLKDVPVGNDYTILPTRDFDILNGISTFDLVLISRHILDIGLIESPYRLIAADVNRSGTITAYDIVQLRRLILRLSTEFPNNTSWRFIRTDFEFEHPSEPNKHYFPEVYNINDLPKTDMQIEGFVAVKVGDVNGSAITKNSFVASESRTAKNKSKLLATDQQLIAGTTVDIPLAATNFDRLLGLQFALEIDPTIAEIVDVLPNGTMNVTAGNLGMDFIDRGLLTMSWEQPAAKENQAKNQPLLTLNLKIKETTQLSDILSLQTEFLKPEAYESSENKAIELLDLILGFENKGTTNFSLYQNKPNPFSATTIVGIEMSQAETIDFSIIDITGKVVKKINYEAQKGYNELVINRKELDGKGVYYYQIATANSIKTKKMIVID